MKKFLLVFGILSILAMVSCDRSGKKPSFKADISDVEEVNLNIGRYDKLLFEIDTLNLFEEIKPHIYDYPFLGDEIYTFEGQQMLLEYITNPLNRVLYEKSQTVWPDLHELERSLSEAFRFYRFHFPDEPLPKVFSYISGVNEQNPITLFDNGIFAIGLDVYLGADFEIYTQLGIPVYLTRKMQPAYVKVDLFKLLAERHLWELSKVPQSFLDFMIYEGKVLHFLDNMLPLTHDTLKIGYSLEQLNWMRNNVGMVWSYFLENEMLYSSDRQTIIKFVGDGPFTAPFGRTSPPRTAAFIGWQIVREYMRKNPNITLTELFSNTNSQEILTQSGYRPR